ncbi:nocobactin polyketide synthase NbtC [Gordonia hankookensis]|uniref:Nocobactin polyketide synthase NbtC n=1 Tax=Gordonia hankookensis TaxID=589403 RepID=A0ABR7WAN6_9ACTN|nr:nocobactin polyketide synthase NbtC [Gordonia hankookensis]MBD1319870.1 nocobactin polyketide synthase NbtC [Gordonia hankookensis]
MSETPPPAAEQTGPRLPDGRTAVLVSSDVADLVVEEADALLAYVRAHPAVTVGAIGSHLMRTRPARRYRALVLAGDREELVDALDSLARGRAHPAVVRGTGSATARRVAYTYPGQGSQRPGMGRTFYDLSAPFRQAVDACHEQSVRLFGSSPRDYVLGEVDPDDPSTTDVRVIQPALFMQMVGLTAMWDAAGATPSLTVGHSQGEIAAAVRSGVMTLSDALTIVTIRARLVHDISPRGHTMAVVGIDVDECEDMLARHSGWAQLSVVNSAHILCVSGRRDTVLEMVDSLSAQGKFAKEIRVEYPAHTSIVSEYQPAFLDALGTYLENSAMLSGDLPCVGATLGAAVDESMALGDYWFWNLRNRVRFDKAIAGAAVEHRADFFIEMSEHPTLLLAMGETLSDIDDDGLAARPVTGTSRRDADGLDEFTRNVAALAVADAGFRWDALMAESRSPIPPVPLEDFPNTVMRRTHLWADRESGLADPINSPEWAAQRAGRSVHRIVSGWSPLSRRKMLSPRRIVVLDPTGRGAAQAGAIQAAAPGHGAVVTVIGPGDDPTPAGDIDTAVLLTGSAGSSPATAPELLADVLADARWRAGLETLPEQFWWITVGGEQVTDSDPAPDLVHGSITAALRCAAAEHPATRFRHLDLEPSRGEPAADAIVAALHIADEPELAIRGGSVHVKRWATTDSVARGPLPKLDHVLITGGTGKLGLEFCEYYASAGAGRITLVSRTGGSADAVRRIEALRRRVDTVIDVVPGDVTDEAGVDRLAEMLAEPVTLLLHAALNYVSTSIDEISRTAVTDSIRAKVAGLQNVVRALPLADGVSVVVCSSLAASLGGRDQALYALANRMLGIAAAQLRDEGIAAASIEWGLWRVQGPLDADGVAAVEGAGVVPMAPAAAMAAGLTDLTGDSIVLSADWTELRDLLGLFGYQPVLADLPDLSTDVVVPITAEHPTVEVGGVVDGGSDPTPSRAAVAEPVSQAGRGASVADLLRAELAVTMGLQAQDADVDPDMPLVALGLDSLQALDFRKRVKTALGQDLPVEAILGGASLHEVVDLIG